MSTRPRARVLTGNNHNGSWLLATRRPPLDLQPYLLSCSGYSEKTGAPQERIETAGAKIVVIFEFGPSIELTTAGDENSQQHAGGFVAGAQSGFVRTRHAGVQSGLQLDLTPLGAYHFFGVPLYHFFDQAVTLADVLAAGHRSLGDQLQELLTWDERFDLIEVSLRARLRETSLPSAAIQHALALIDRSGGMLDFGPLPAKLGYSHKHVMRLFREHVGTTPKRWSRLVRFERWSQFARSQGGLRLPCAQQAVLFGYHDQPHLAREARLLSNATPGEVTQATLFGQ